MRSGFVCDEEDPTDANINFCAPGHTAGSDAQGKVPTKFVGHWCASPDQTGTFTRGRCRNPDNDGKLTVNADGFVGHETWCKARSPAVPKGGSYQIKFACTGEGDSWNELSRMSLDSKGRLKFRIDRR